MLYEVITANSQIIKMIMKGIIQKGTPSDRVSAECRGSHIKKHLTQYLTDLKHRGEIKDDPILISELFMNCMNGYLFSAFIFRITSYNVCYTKLLRSLGILRPQSLTYGCTSTCTHIPLGQCLT